MDALQQAIERIAEGTPLRSQAEAELAALRELLRRTAADLREYHDDWNEELGAGCVPGCKTVELLAEVEAALKGKTK